MAGPSLTELSSARRYLVLAICCLSLFIVGVDVTIVNVALPAIQRSLHASVSGLQWTVDAYTLVIACYLQDVRGYPPLRAGLLTIPMAVMIAVLAQVSGRLVGRRGPRIPFALAGPALAIAAVLLARLTAHTPVSYLVLAYVIFGIGSGLVAAPITSTAVAGMPTAQAGVAGAIASTGRQVGSSLGVAVTGSIVATTASASFVAASHAAWLVIAGCGLAVLVVGLASTGPWAQRTAARNSDRLVPLPQENSDDRPATASR